MNNKNTSKVKKTEGKKLYNQKYYIGFPGCVMEKNFTLFTKLGKKKY